MKSSYKIDDEVSINLYECGYITNGIISKISFTKNKVYYDIEIKPFSNEPDNKDIKLLLKQIDSYFIEPPLKENEFIEKQIMKILKN